MYLYVMQFARQRVIIMTSSTARVLTTKSVNVEVRFRLYYHTLPFHDKTLVYF